MRGILVNMVPPCASSTTNPANSSLQVFFAILIGAFALGLAGPSVQVFSVARGAAYIVYNLIDQVSLSGHFAFVNLISRGLS